MVKVKNMPEFYTWVILLINRSKEIGKKQLSIFGSRGGPISPLMHIALYSEFLTSDMRFVLGWESNLSETIC